MEGGTLHFIAFVIGLSIISFLHVVFGELAPKTIAIQSAEGTSLFVAPFMKFFSYLLLPATYLFNGTANAFTRLLGYPPASESDETHSEDEIRILVAQSARQGMLERDEEGMIRAVFGLNDKTARDLMRDVLTIPENRLIDEILEDLRRQDLQMAVVIDEWGSFEGLFTLEDIVEEIVGERSGTSSTTRSQPAKSCATAPTAWTGASR